MVSLILKIVVVILSVCITTSIFASEVLQSFILPLSYESETNPRLTVNENDSIGIERFILVPEYSIAINQDREQWFAGATVRIERPSDTNLSQDRNDVSLNLGWTHHYKSGQFDVRSFVENQSTETSEFQDSGDVILNNTRKTGTVLFNWIHNLSSRTSVEFNSDLSDVTYERQTISLNDYQSMIIDTKLNYLLNGQVDIFTLFTFINFQSDDINNIGTFENQTKSVDVGTAWSSSENLIVTSSLGINDSENITRNEIGLSQRTDNRWQGLLRIDYTTENTISQFQVSRSLSTRNSGIIESDRLIIGWVYQFSDRHDLAFNYNWQQNLDFDEIETLNFSAIYTKQMTSKWDFQISGVYRSRIDENDFKAESNTLIASIIYKLLDF